VFLRLNRPEADEVPKRRHARLDRATPNYPTPKRPGGHWAQVASRHIGKVHWKLGVGIWALREREVGLDATLRRERSGVHKSGRVSRSRAGARMIRRKLKALSASRATTAVGVP